MTRYISFLTLLAVIVLLIVLFYKVMAGFFVPLFLAALLVVIFRPLHLLTIDRCKGKQKMAALLTTIGILLSVLVPLAILFVLAAFESQQVVEKLDKDTLVRTFNDTRERLNLTLPELSEDLEAVESRLANIGESDRLEDVIYLREELRNTGFYNDDLGGKLDADANVTESWDAYVESFKTLQEIQSEIAHLQTLDADTFEDDLSDDRENDFQPLTPEDEETLDDENEAQPRDIAANTENDAEPDSEPKSWSDRLEKDKVAVDSLNPTELMHEFSQQLDDTEQKFSTFKVQALGGSRFWIWVRETANPTQLNLAEYGGSAINTARKFLVGLGASTTSFLGRLLLGGAIMIISLYFFLLDGPAMLDSLKQLSPIEDKHEQELFEEFGRVSRAVVVATLLAALVQALLGGIGYYFAGLESVFLLTLLTGCLALVPFVGAAAVWVPCALWLFFVENNTTAAIGLSIYGAVVISMADNLIKPLVLHGQSNLHPLFALLSVLGGVATLGPIGILIGPMIVAFLQTLLKILQRELASLDANANSNENTNANAKAEAKAAASATAEAAQPASSS